MQIGIMMSFMKIKIFARPSSQGIYIFIVMYIASARVIQHQSYLGKL
jgi:hypothetical protein